jgi:hypothetical protein
MGDNNFLFNATDIHQDILQILDHDIIDINEL